MTSEELRITLIRQTQAIRKALFHIEALLPYYEKTVEEEHRAKTQASQPQAETEKTETPPEAPREP